MSIEGAGAWRQFASVTWVYLSPTTFVVLLMSIVNFSSVGRSLFRGLEQYVGGEWYGVVITISSVAISFFILYAMYRKKIWLRV